MKHKVLVIDDSALARRALRRILEPAGYDVVEAEDGLVALELYALDRPDLVVLDLVMKGMYGLEVLAKLLELDPEARVLVVSADIQVSSQRMVAEAGAKGFVNKPFDREQLLEALQAAGARVA